MNFKLYLGYLTERYTGNEFLPTTLEDIANDFHKIQTADGKTQIYETPESFITYKLEGDALICYDIYVAPEARKKGKGDVARELWNHIQDKARQTAKRLIIGFTERNGKNQHLGKRVLEFIGMKPMQENEFGTVYFKGI